MTSKERIYAAIANQPSDRVPFTFWKHFPVEEETGQGLARAVVSFQEKFNFDLVKITPASSSITEIWGSKYAYRQDPEGIRKGVRHCIFTPVNDYRDLKKIKEVGIEGSPLGGELEAIKIIRQKIDKNIPVVHTVPSPLTIVKMFNGENWIKMLKDHPQEFHAALANITETVKEFIKLAFQNGADGLFYYTHCATYDFLTEEEYKIFGKQYDLEVLNEVKRCSDLLVLHIHGKNIMFGLLKDYPVQIINWHDRITFPSLADAKKTFKGALLGGVDEWNVLLNGSYEEIKAQVEDAINQTGGKGLIIGPGCILPADTPEQNIMAVKDLLGV